MRRIVFLLLLTSALAACSGVAIGPVSHACLGNPSKSEGSGCNDSHRD